MNKVLLTISALILIVFSAFTQGANEEFTANNFSWFHESNGQLFYDSYSGLPGLEVPAGEGNPIIFASLFWVAGLDENGSIRLHETDFQYPVNESIENWGPVNYPDQNDPTEVGQYNKVWFVTVEQVNEHLAYYDCLNNSNCNIEETFPDGYDIPEDFLDWPGTSDNPNFDQYLAPFLDYNNDGVYNAEDGDCPNFCGDFCSYSINNDIGTTNNPEDPNDIGLEMHTQVYGYNSEEGAVFNTLFMKRKVIHKGEHTLSDTYFGQWTDFDVGNFNDDYVRTDVQRSMVIGYNGDKLDEGSTNGPGYGSDLPMLGVRYLSGPLKDANGVDDEPISDEYDTYANFTSGWGDGIVDNEKLGLAYSMYHNNGNGPPATWFAVTPLDFYNYLRGLWRDGTPMVYEQNGYNPDSEFPVTRYVYPGLTDPLLHGTDGIDPEYPSEDGWTEVTAGNPPADRRTISSSGPFTFAPGDVQYFDLAYIFARESHDEDETVLETLQRYADEVADMACDPLPNIVLSDGLEEAALQFEMYPVPAQDFIQFKLGEEYRNIKINILDLNGRAVQQFKPNRASTFRLNIDLAPAVYVVQLIADGNMGNKKIIITE